MHEAQRPRNLFWRNNSDGEGRGFQGESTSGSTCVIFQSLGPSTELHPGISPAQ